MNPLASHWLRLAILLLIASPIVALVLGLTQDDVGFRLALALTLYMWAVVCVILAAIALAGLLVRLCGRGIRAIRR
jgi:hypothetical protein